MLTYKMKHKKPQQTTHQKTIKMAGFPEIPSTRRALLSKSAIYIFFVTALQRLSGRNTNLGASNKGYETDNNCDAPILRKLTIKTR